MSFARMDRLASLRKEVERLETGGGEQPVRRAALGHAEADAALRGGLPCGAMHELFAADGLQAGAASGFALGLARRVTQGCRFVLWIRQDFSAIESGELSMTGFAELGLDPRRLVAVHAPSAEMVLRIAAEAVACNGLGVVVAELFGETRAFDLAASRRLTLAAGSSGVTALMLRLGAVPQASTAETRWIVRAAHSPPAAAWQAWGWPALDVELARNRHGPAGRWIMEWVSDEYRFREQATHSRRLAAAPAGRSYPPPAAAGRRRRA